MKEQLLVHGVQLDEMGGDVKSVELSAVTVSYNVYVKYRYVCSCCQSAAFTEFSLLNEWL